jgi:hypothetical protein
MLSPQIFTTAQKTVPYRTGLIMLHQSKNEWHFTKNDPDVETVNEKVR